jgi:16S rRNA (cytosine1402-N4)-methyltransferase
MHTSVLKKEVIEYFDPGPDENFIDGTIGDGGHGLAILERNKPNGRLLGIDWDLENINRLKLENQKLVHLKRLILANNNFANLRDIVKKEKFKNVHGILFDLGMSNRHLETSGKGFSFLKDEPLKMNYGFDPLNELTAEKILNRYTLEEIEKVLREYGEERFSQKIAEEIVKKRKAKPLVRTIQLVEVIEKAVPNWYKRRKIHCATKTFQAIRIAVNSELDNLKKVLPQAMEILKPGGKLAIISFHSLEDRIVKNYFKKMAKENILKIITKKPIVTKEEEIKINRRSRSAKLRVAIKK